MRILITNIASVTAISIIKILRKSKISNLCIWGTEAQEYGYNSGSLLVDHYIKVPKVSVDCYSQNIMGICQNNAIEVLIPILDEELYLFSVAKINNYVKLLLPSIKMIKLFRNKLLANLELNRWYPKIIPHIYNNCTAISENKVIIRQKESIGSQGILVKKREQFSSIDFDDSNYFVQEYIDGSEYTVDILADIYGNVKLIIPRERLQIKNGVSTKVRITKDQDMINLCKQIYSKYCIPGLSNVQFIKRNNNIYFIELNMRFAGMGIASLLASYDYFSEYIMYLTSGSDLGNYSTNMDKVKWGTVVCRYYEETVLMQ